MKIYGVALLAGCFMIGKLMGELLGLVLNINGNVGGVGFAMALLIGMNTWMSKRYPLKQDTQEGILFWSAMYIPIVVAMSATLHVKAALSGGWVALIVGVTATLLCMYLVPLVSRIGKKSTVDSPSVSYTHLTLPTTSRV